MRYVGGKTRIAKWVAEHVLSLRRGGETTYLEPFVGSGATFKLIAPHFENAVASDAHPDLIMMWQAMAAGWRPSRDWVSKEEYAALKKAPADAWRGLVGFGSSYSGKWFGGYVDTPWDSYHKRFVKPSLATAIRVASETSKAMAGRKIFRAGFEEHSPGSTHIVYCDPPYAGTQGYGGAFDHARFWDVAGQWRAAGATVVVSEESAPDGWRVLAERTRKAFLGPDKARDRSERLFV